MATWSSEKPSKWLKAAHLNNKEHTATIESISKHEVGDSKKNVVFFVGKSKGFPLNVTNGDMLESLYGEEMNNWLGKSITLYPTTTRNNQGDVVACIRFKPPGQQPLSDAMAGDVPPDGMIDADENPSDNEPQF